jgi:hypothetical protein
VIIPTISAVLLPYRHDRYIGKSSINSIKKEVKVEDAAARTGPARRNTYRGRYKSSPTPVAAKQESRFDGRCDALKGFTFDCTDGQQTDQYAVNMKEISIYVGREYAHGGDIRWTVVDERRFKVPKPVDPTDEKPTFTDKKIWKQSVVEYVRRNNKLTQNMETMYSLIFGQCTEYMLAKLKGLPEYNSFNDGVDMIKLLKAIEGLTYHFEGQRYQAMALHGALTRFYTLRQDRNITHAQYLEKFQTNVAVVEQFGDNIGRNTGAVRAELESAGFTDQTTAGVEDKLAATQRAKDKYLAVAFLCSADKARYTLLLEDMDNAYLYGTHNYPVNITSA